MGDPQQPMAGAPAANNIDLTKIQGDILKGGFAKKSEIFYFFKINDAKRFAQALKGISFSSVADVQADRARIPTNRDPNFPWPMFGVNIAFTITGLDKIKKNKPGTLQVDDIKKNAQPFATGMEADGPSLGDPEWTDSRFKGRQIDGVLIIAGSSQAICQAALSSTLAAFGSPEGQDIPGQVITRIAKEIGNARPGIGDGKEHFGFEDGISQPQVRGIDDQGDPKDNPKAFDNLIEPSTLLITKGSPLPDWMENGSFFCFRKLEQDVAAWNTFVKDGAKKLGIPEATFGAKLMGRWQSGRPIVLEDKDEDSTNVDPLGNDFTFQQGNMDKCPFGAHIRKSNPRGSQFFGVRIMRRGIPYGTDFVPGKTTDTNRGLLFACYQSDFDSGYRFIQQAWANSSGFPEGVAGLDTVMGQIANKGKPSPAGDEFKIQINGSKTGTAKYDRVNQFVTPRGGEYFFAPSITALKKTLTLVA